MAQAVVRQRKKSASRKAQLIEVAAQIFLERGYKETGIETILGQAGLTGPALYRHFSSKQEILDTICIDAGRRMLQLALEVQHEDGLSPKERLARLINLRLDYLFSPSGISSFVASSQRAHVSAQARERTLAMQREFGDIFASFLKGVRPDLTDDQRRLMFFAIQNMMLYGIWRSRRRGLVNEEEYREILERMVWSTLMA